VVPIEDRPYGRCEGRVRDPFGHLWIPSHPVLPAPRPLVRRIVADLATADVGQSVAFYRDVFGLDVVLDAGWIVTLATEAGSTTQLTLLRRDATATVDAEVSIEVDDLDLVLARVVDLGAEIVHLRSVEEWGVERFFVRDPAGHVVNVLAHRRGDG
jgi:catechol 2,3-dioxygenase-like lactoylglutathione lyase family enzyme